MATEFDNKLIVTSYVKGVQNDVLEINVNAYLKATYTYEGPNHSRLLKALYDYGYTCNYFGN